MIAPVLPVGSAGAVAVARLRAAVRSGRARAVRELAGLSQAELAASVGVSRSALCLWEGGVRTPRAAASLRYLAALDALAVVTGEPLDGTPGREES